MQMQLPLVLLLLGIFRLAGAATIQRRDPHVLSVSQSGPGCPQGAPDVNVTGPWDALSFSIPAFEADVKFNRGRDQPVRCEIHVQLGGGWPGGRMLVNEVTLKGYAMTEPDTELTVWVGAYWSGTGSKRPTFQRTITNNSTRSRASRPVLRFSGFDEVSNCVGDDGFVGILTINMRVGATAGGWGWFGGYGEDAPIVQEVRSEWIKCAENIEGSSGRE